MPSITHDPVCGRRINRNKTHIVLHYKGWDVLLCCPLCQSEFQKDPERYVKLLEPKKRG